MLVSLIFDIIVVLFFIYHIYFGSKKGFFRALFGLCGNLISLAISNILSIISANYIYDNFICKVLTKNINSELQNGSKGFVSSMQEILNSLPNVLKTYLAQFDISSENLSNMLKMDIASASASIASLMKPIVSGTIQIIVFIALFFVMRVLMSFLIKALNKTTKLPICSSLNSFLGSVLGFVQAFILLYIVCWILKFILILNPTSELAIILSNVNIDSSYLFKYIYYFNPFTA